MKALRSNPKHFSSPIIRISPLAAAAFFTMASAAFGASDSWTNAAGGSWTDTGSWSLGSAPGGNNDAIFNLGSTSGYTVTLPSSEGAQNIDVDTDTMSLNLNGRNLAAGFNGPGTGSLDVGAASGQNGSLIVAGGTLEPEFEVNIGANGGTGSATFDDVNVNSNGFSNNGIYVGVGLNSVGTLTAKDGAQLNDGSEGLNPSLYTGDMGAGGTGTVNLNDATATLGEGSSEGSVEIGGNGTLTLTNHSTFTYTGNATGPSSFAVFGTAAGGGSLSVDNSTLSIFNCPITVASGGTLTATDNAQVTGGAGIVVGSSFLTGNSPPKNIAVGSAKIIASGTGTTLKAFGMLDVGDNGTTGTVTLAAASQLVTFNTYVGGNGGNGSVQLSGSGTAWTAFAASNPVTVIGANSSGQAGTGTVQLDTGATWTTPGTVTLDAGGTLNVLSGANLIVKNLDLSHGGTTNFTGGTITLTGGTLTAPTFSLPNTSTLAGTGTLTGNLTSSGSVSPGDAPGILNVSGNYIQNSNGTLNIGLGGTTASAQYDQLQITGSASLTGTIDVTLLGAFSPAVGNSFDLFTDASESGAFTNFELPALAQGSWDTSNLYTTGVITVVSGPQPITVASGQTDHFTASTGTGIHVTTVLGLTVHTNGTAIVDPVTNHANRQLLVVTGSGLTLDGSSGHWTGLLDLGNNDLDLPGALLATVTDQIHQGSGGGAWNGTGGITSSSAAADTAHLTALGVIQNNQGGAPLYTTFDGQTVGASDVLVKFTYYGDALLTGSVTAADYLQIDNGFDSQNGPNPLVGWYNGDFNYDGVINGDDYTLIDNAFNTQGSVSVTSTSAGPAEMIAATTDQIATPAAVPEPGTLGLLAMGVAGLLMQRQRNHRRSDHTRSARLSQFNRS